MQRPDFARSDLTPLPEGDLRFLVENMPTPGRSYEEIAVLLAGIPTTLESMLSSDYVLRSIRDRERLILDISPFLFFNVLLRHSIGHPHSPLERRVIHYLANLLTLFIRAERVVRVEAGDDRPCHYVTELLTEAAHAEPRRAFATYAHIGNYTLWLTGLNFAWLDYRHRFGRRPVSPLFYVESGQSGFERAAGHALAREYQLRDVFLRLAIMFEFYRRGLARLQREYL